MAPLKMWGLLPIAVLLLLTISPTLAKVVQSMTQCGDFLLNNKLPQVPGVLEKGQIKGKNTYKVICQTFNNVSRFVTLYDTRNKIPVLSAAKFTGGERDRPEDEHWKIEPQLEDGRNDENMQDSSPTAKYEKQAGDSDYADVSYTHYDRGHLFPSSFANQNNDKISTFTLTNAVPQVMSFNRGSWARMEACVRCVMERFCINSNGNIDGYVMIGAKPSNNKRTEEKRVNVPSLLWSTFCCYSNNLGRWIASASLGENVREEDELMLETNTLDQLYNELSDGEKRFEAFPGSSCPLETTVAELYPQLNQNCHCV